MAKKVKDDDFEDDFDEFEDDTEEVTNSNQSDDEEESESESEIQIDDDEDNLDIVIEIDEDDLNITEPEVPKVDETEADDIVLSKHKIEGKHSLKYDSIFKGKKEDPLSEDDLDGWGMYHKESIEVDKSSNYYFESVDNERYIRAKLVKEKVYVVLNEHTTINFLNNRRKPSRSDFNHYYSLLKNNLQQESFTNVELFNELAVYFSDNLFNMFKLLDKKYRNMIISELQDHIGKNANAKDITNRNIYEGTELEFEWQDEITNQILSITGDVVETDYLNSMFKVNSYERIYEVKINQITKILNNTKFKYNLNKLNNIDFL